jgi:hypothetical protein
MRIEVSFIAEDGDSPQDEPFGGRVMVADNLVNWSMQTPQGDGQVVRSLQLYATGRVAWQDTAKKKS